ncbi:hypothetical protein M011DRAFT_268621 [Sporormia fimetaria CBS 119925]|uniref:Transmembrane protein n=1 Tax=Sporormia fimetaria CBS 119925 TaxID=1340428 RepID=A0A6A6UVT7_9PLEO|nr:hypothetical protein M011DRAFT_268621 [Sporormia fimetaria CBS 119925]
MSRVTSERYTRNDGDQRPRKKTKITKQNQCHHQRTCSTPLPPHPSAFSLSVFSILIVNSFFLFHLSKMPFSCSYASLAQKRECCGDTFLCVEEKWQ